MKAAAQLFALTLAEALLIAATVNCCQAQGSTRTVEHITHIDTCFRQGAGELQCVSNPRKVRKVKVCKVTSWGVVCK